MSLELVKEKIFLDQNIGRETTQILVEGDIIVPDIKPDMAVILQTDAKVRIDRAEASADRVNFIGKLDLQVLYIAKSSERPVHSMSLSTSLDNFINMEGVTKDMWVEATGEIANIDYKMLNDRKINYRAIININVNAEHSEDHEIVVHITDIPSNQLLKSNLNINRGINNKIDRFIVKDEITVPTGKPNISEILQCSAQITNKDMRVVAGRVTVTGAIALTTLYRGDSDDSIIEFMENEVSFNGAVDVPGAKEDMFADITLAISDQYIQVRADSDGEERIIDAEITVNAMAKVYSSETLEILEDAYSINQMLNISKESIKYPRLICRNRNQTPIKEVIQIDDNCPDILQVFRIVGHAHLDDVKVIEDKVIAEGIIDADILYVAKSDDTPLFSHKAVIPYRQVIETKGSGVKMHVKVDTAIDHVAFNMLSDREVEVRFLLTFNTVVIEEKEMNVITNIDFSDMDKCLLDNMASMTIYVVQPGDSLWKIAKQYNTAVDELLSVNEIENPSKIYPGQKLLILKKIL